MPLSRRDFVKVGSALSATALLNSQSGYAKELHLPLGLQLYSVRDLLPKDYNNTLKELGAIGYREVESAGYYGKSAKEVKQAMADAGLKLVSAHLPLDALTKQLDTILLFHQQLGVEYLICSYPGFRDRARLEKIAPTERETSRNMDDWKWNAEQFNAIGEKVSAAGIKFGYHNHHIEFNPTEGKVPLDELFRLTDPAKVVFELDCGWVIVGGHNPVDYLSRYPARIEMLHVKDFKMPAAPSASEQPKVAQPKIAEPVIAELGRGSIDYAPVFAEAAKAGHIRHIFVEQEAFDMPWKESLAVDAAYMRRLGAA